MAENNQVQLKREEIVDQDVVLSDINPSTNTGSVLDDTTGGSLNKTLERILNSINNKLARNVNSVNGRTGVVVIDKGDVNLGNVDNVSFDDIKRWVLEQLAKAFSKHTIKLFNNLHEAAMFAEDHDQTYSGTAFFSDKGYTDSSMEYVDNRSYIGYFEYDEGNEILTMHYLPISTVGSTDNSIIYNTNIKGDFRGGKIGVNIYKYPAFMGGYTAGGYVDIRFGEHWGAELGAYYSYGTFTHHRSFDPIVTPYYRFSDGSKLYIPVGPFVKYGLIERI